jgi:hypothetical protein
MRTKLFDQWIYEGMHPMVQGRHQHLRGEFDKQGDVAGAKQLYMSARISDADIKQIETSEELQQSMGIVRDRENDQEWAVRLQMSQQIARRIKQNATYWLGLIQFETGNDEASIDFLKTRTLEASEDGPWTHGARYNLSRAYERQGRLTEARRLLLLDESPQKHGNLLRARRIRRQLEAAESEGRASSPGE